MDNIKDYVTYPKKIKHYDTSKRPKRQTKFAAGVMYLLSKALMPRQVQGYKIDKINTENLKPARLKFSASFFISSSGFERTKPRAVGIMQ